MTVPVEVAGSVEELRERRDFLLRSLEDLEAERRAGDIGEDDYEALRRHYTAQAAAVLRALDERAAEGRQLAVGEAPAGVAVATTGPAAPVASARRVDRRPTPRAGRWRSALTGAAVLAVAAGAGMVVAATSGERLPGQEATGSLPAGTVDRVTQAQALVSEGKVLEAVKLYDEVIRDDPDNPVALSQRGWLVSRAGLIDEGLASIDKAIAVDPGYHEAHFFRAMILWRAKGDPAAAAEEFRLVLENRPPRDLVAYVRDALQRALADAAARSGAGQAGTESAGTDQAPPPDQPPGTAQAPQPDQSAGTDPAPPRR